MKMKLFAMVMVTVIVSTCVSCGSGGNPAPLGVSAEPADLFRYEFDAEYNGIVLTRYSGMKSSVKVPDKIDGLPVVGIDDSCFKVGQVTEVYFPDTLKYFKFGGLLNYATGAKNMETVTIPKGVTEITSDAFCGFSFTSITIPDSVTIIGSSAFELCKSLTSITIPNSVTYIDSFAFEACRSLINITISNSVTEIDSYAFKNCTSLTSITIPDSVITIGNYAFDSCISLTNITIPNSVTTIGSRAFNDCHSLTNAIYNGVTYSVITNQFGQSFLPPEFYNTINGK